MKSRVLIPYKEEQEAKIICIPDKLHENIYCKDRLSTRSWRALGLIKGDSVLPVQYA